MSSVLDNWFGIEQPRAPDTSAALAASGEAAARSQRIALAQRVTQDNQAGADLAKRPRVSRTGRRLLQYSADNLGSSLG